MKNIKVSDEVYASLVELSKEINSQDNRATAMPYFFQIQTKEMVTAVEGDGTEAWFYDGAIIETDQEIEEAVTEYKGWDEHTTKFNHLDKYDIEAILEEAEWSKIWYEMKNKLENSFFTSKACNEHLQANKHRYTDPVNYLSYAFRNPEMELVFKFLCELTGGKIHR